jgi:DNA repair protein RecO (recombination protein O)
MVNSSKKENQNIYILHTYPFKETSLIVEMLTKDFGRIAVTAKGARRPKSSLRGMLLPFQPLQATWSGLQDLKSLHNIEWSDAFSMIKGDALVCGFYLNELIMRLVPKDDPCPKLYDFYHKTILELASNNFLSITLRRFELKLLKELGYQVPLKNDVDGVIIESEKQYFYDAESSAFTKKISSDQFVISGKTLIDMANDCYEDSKTEQQSKQFMRYLINHYIGDKPLHSKQLFMSDGEKIN